MFSLPVLSLIFVSIPGSDKGVLLLFTNDESPCKPLEEEKRDVCDDYRVSKNFGNFEIEDLGFLASDQFTTRMLYITKVR